jgi:YfiH family protein
MEFLTSPRLLQLGFRHGFSLRIGGANPPSPALNQGSFISENRDHLAENYREIERTVGCAPDRLFELTQVHGAVVRPVDSRDRVGDVRRENGDALVTREPSVAVGVRVADCLSLLLADPSTGAVAAVHAGWRGVVAGVVDAAIAALVTRAQTRVERVEVVIFPHIRSCCFEVDESVAGRLAAVCATREVVDNRYRKPHVDLASIVKAQLNLSGITDDRIDDVAGCTRCQADRFFSYRRDGELSGRHLAAIAVRG